MLTKQVYALVILKTNFLYRITKNGFRLTFNTLNT